MYKTYCYGTQHSAFEQLLDNSIQKSSSHQEGVITLRLSQNMFEGSTGCHEWEAGFFLAEYILNHPELVRGVLFYIFTEQIDGLKFLCHDLQPITLHHLLLQPEAAALPFCMMGVFCCPGRNREGREGSTDSSLFLCFPWVGALTHFRSPMNLDIGANSDRGS